jgi:hypothetical protein
MPEKCILGHHYEIGPNVPNGVYMLLMQPVPNREAIPVLILLDQSVSDQRA